LKASERTPGKKTEKGLQREERDIRIGIMEAPLNTIPETLTTTRND
jgi:hypothetical protein